MFNHRERQALLCLTALLIVGTGVALVDYWSPHSLEEFRVVRGAVAVEPTAVESEPEWIDLNRASAIELEQLPAIGPKTAAQIVDYRQRIGPFSRAEDLLHIRGIGAATLEKLRPFLRIEERPRKGD